MANQGQQEIMIPAVMMKAFVVVVLGTLLMSATVFNGHFERAKVELGLSHYAERVHPSMAELLPVAIEMPLNTLINIGYVIVGSAWCAYTSLALNSRMMSEDDARMFYIFNLASCCYGPIQMLRILTQVHGFGVLDQWYTLPIFMWVFVWGLHILRGWSTFWSLLLVTTSVFSYTLVLINPIGFEVCLAVHVLLAVAGALAAWGANSQARCGKYFILALLSCAGFVGLKVIDLDLPQYSPIFNILSGHFLSKICDVLQIHYVNHYFNTLTQSKYSKTLKTE